MRQLTPDGAEFLVLGNLLVRGIYAHKNYINTPDYDVVAINPRNKKVVKIEVKSRQYKDAKVYLLKSFKPDFVVFVQLNKYVRRKIYKNRKRVKKMLKNKNNINYIILPIKIVKSLKRKKRRSAKRTRISLTSLYPNKVKKYENDSGWNLIKKKLK